MTDIARQARQPIAKRTLTALSYAVEELALGAGPDAVLISLFQRDRYFAPHVGRYEQLASTGLTVVVAHSGDDQHAVGVHNVRLADDDPLADEWAVVLLGPTLAVHVGGRDLHEYDEGDAGLEPGRRFDLGWGLERRSVAGEAARLLEAVRTSIDPATAATIDRAIAAAAGARVTEAESALAAAAAVLVQRLEASHHDLGRLQARLAEETELAARDPLTGLLNRTGLERWMAHGADDGPGRTIPTTGIVLLDLDGFKQVNDTHGHLVGDQLLQHIAGTLTHHTRPGDVVCRWGGDEFLVLCPGVSDAELLMVADRLVAAVAATSAGPASVNVSAGVQTASSTPIPLERVDAALYAAKAAGGGQAVAADG